MPEITPQYNRLKVLVGQAAMYIQKYNPSTPPAMPPNTLALGAAWPAPWVPLGATREGLNFGFSRESTDITIEEQPNPVDVRTSNLAFNMNTTLSEDSLETMRIAYGGGTITSVPAGAGTWGYDELTIADEMEDFSFGFEGKNHLGYPRRCVIPVVKSVGEIETTYRRAAEQRLYAVSFRSLVPLSQCPIRTLTAPPTA